MLQTSSIPQYTACSEPPEDWSRFLYKACKGSIKADDILVGASWAYMVALTGDQTAPETMNEGDYREIFAVHFQ